jgi:signal transduction histidine kinase
MSDNNTQYKKLFGEAMPQIVHDIRNPLNIIIGYSSILQMDSSLSEENRQYIQKVYQSGLAIEDLLSDIDFFDLDLSEFESERVNIAELVKQYVEYYKETLGNDIYIEMTNIADVTTFLPPVIFKKLFNNLFGFSNKGFKTSSVNKKIFISVTADGDVFRIMYSDTTMSVSLDGDYFTFDDSVHARRGLFPLFLENAAKSLGGTIRYLQQKLWQDMRNSFAPNTQHGFIIDIPIVIK